MTTTSNQDLIGRDGLNDLDAILSMTNTDVDAAVHAITDNADAIFTWDYEKGARPGLNKLYEKAKTSQWNGETDLPWDTDVDLEKVAQLLLPSFGGPKARSWRALPLVNGKLRFLAEARFLVRTSVAPFLPLTLPGL